MWGKGVGCGVTRIVQEAELCEWEHRHRISNVRHGRWCGRQKVRWHYVANRTAAACAQARYGVGGAAGAQWEARGGSR